MIRSVFDRWIVGKITYRHIDLPYQHRADPIEYIDNNIRSLEVVLDQGDLQEIEEGLSNIKIRGARLSESLLAWSE